jgi:hypothetical protein
VYNTLRRLLIAPLKRDNSTYKFQFTTFLKLELHYNSSFTAASLSFDRMRNQRARNKKKLFTLLGSDAKPAAASKRKGIRLSPVL